MSIVVNATTANTIFVSVVTELVKAVYIGTALDLERYHDTSARRHRLAILLTINSLIDSQVTATSNLHKKANNNDPTEAKI